VTQGEGPRAARDEGLPETDIAGSHVGPEINRRDESEQAEPETWSRAHDVDANGSDAAEARYVRELEIALASLARTLALAPAENKMTVFAMVTREAVAHARKFYVPEREVLDHFADLAVSNGLVEEYGDDAVQAALDGALAPRPNGKGNGAVAPEAWWRQDAVTGAELQTMMFPPLRFVVPDIMPEGVALLAGKPKAGKSWMVLDLAIAATSDRYTLGEIKPEQGDVLYLALEDSLRRAQWRMTKLLGACVKKWPERLTIKTEWKRVDQGGLDGIEQWARSVERPVMVIVDTLQRVRPIPSPSSKVTPYTLDYTALEGLQALAAKLQLLIVVITHVRKATADDVFDTVSGTLGLTAAADTLLVLGPKNGLMTLCVRGRDVEEAEKAVRFDKGTCRWTIIGEAPQDAPRSDTRGRVLAALRAAGRAMSVAEIMKAAGLKSRQAADQMLSRMVDQMEIRRPSRGVYAEMSEVESEVSETSEGI
jgi:AAA domain